MRFHGSFRLLVAFLVGASLALGSISSAFAGPTERYKQQAEQFQKMLDQAASNNGAEAAQKDIDQARKWLEDANVLLAKGDDEAASNLLRRVKFCVELVNHMVSAGNIQHAADEQEAAYYGAKDDRIPELEAEVEELKERKKELQSQLDKLR